MRHIILFVVFMTFWGCAGRKQLENFRVISVDFNHPYKGGIGGHIETESRILLAEKEDQFVGIADNVIFRKNLIFVLDSKKKNALFVYDPAGNLKAVIDYVGQAEGEFTRPDNFDVDADRDEIIILDANNRKLLFYDFEGKYIRNLSIDFFVTSFILYGRDKIILDKGNSISDKSGKGITIIDRQTGNRIKDLFDVPEYMKNMTFTPFVPLMMVSDTVVYQPSMSNCLYRIVHDEIQPGYSFDFGSRWPSEHLLRELEDTHPMQIMEKLLAHGYALFLNMWETDRFVCVDFNVSKDERMLCYYDKESRKSRLIKLDKEEELCPVSTTPDNRFIATEYDENGSLTLVLYNFKPL